MWKARRGKCCYPIIFFLFFLLFYVAVDQIGRDHRSVAGIFDDFAIRANVKVQDRGVRVCAF